MKVLNKEELKRAGLDREVKPKNCEIEGCKEPVNCGRWRMWLCESHSNNEDLRQRAFHSLVARMSPDPDVRALHAKLS